MITGAIVVVRPAAQVIPAGPGLIAGPPGESAFQSAQDQGFTGTVQQWLASLVGAPGVPGQPGSNGANGLNGSNGNTVLNGAGAPALGAGNSGDFYVDTANSRLYGPKASGAWPSAYVSLIGPQGAAGSNGTNGANGSNGTNGTNGAAWYSGTSAPAAGTGVVGDWYINTATGDLYTKGSGGWGSPVINITAVSGAVHYDVAQSLNTAQIAQALANLGVDGAEASVSSAATTDIGSTATQCVAITGTTAITSFGTQAKRIRFVRFAGALTLTHDATKLILPGGVNIVTAAGDTCVATSDASGNWRVRTYERAQGSAATQTAAYGVTSASGTLSSATANVRYRRIDAKLVWVAYDIYIYTNGSGAGSISVALPFTAATGIPQPLVGRENAATGKELQGIISSGGSVLTVLNYDNTYPGGNGYELTLAGIYEVA